MFTDIVKSTNLVDAMGDEAWEGVLERHDQTLRSCFSAHHGLEINKVGDGFFVGFDSPGDAVECAVTVQRRLRQESRHSYVPKVRVGLHRAEATQKGRDYGGKGVHAAARIGALAGAGEILASRDVIDAADLRFPVSEPRSITLKGVSEPVEVASIIPN